MEVPVDLLVLSILGAFAIGFKAGGTLFELVDFWKKKAGKGGDS